jgi:RND family efflux transporter MFP subunit
MINRQKLLFISSALLVLLSVSLTQTFAQQAQRPAQVVRTATVQMAEIAPSMSVPGTVYSRDESQIMAGNTGTLSFVAEPGTLVKKGDVVASIDKKTLRLQRAEQVALLDRAKISIKQLESDFRRQSELRNTKLVSEFVLEQTAATRDLAIADADIIRIRIKQIDDQISRTNTKAQFNGVVIERMHRTGEEVTRGTTLARITATDNLEIRAFVPLKHLSRIHVGDQLDIFNNDLRVNGVIRVLIPNGDIRSQTFEARVDIPTNNSALLTVGQLVSVTIPIKPKAVSLAIPRDALVLRNDGSYVYRINSDNKAERISVELGDSAGDLIAIVGGLNEGDEVAVRGGETLSDGADVRIVEG